MRNSIIAAVAVVLVSCASLAVAELPATVSVGGGWIALGVGANWGDGVLTFRGDEYSFGIKGLSLGDFGAAGFTGCGTVRGLERPEDFNGKYTNVGKSPTVVADGAHVTMRNEHGVTIDLAITTPGLKISLGRSSLEMEIEPQPSAIARR